MLRLEDLSLFVRTAALGSFSAAAREADLLPGQASAAIARLERDLGRRLFARSTRSLRLTAEGERYLPYAEEVLATLAEGRERLREQAETLSGPLNLAVPSDLGRNLLLPWLGSFCRTHPQLRLRLSVSDQRTDLFRDPVDVALRYGRLSDASFVALPLVEDNCSVLVASPAYLAQRGNPASLDELSGHDALLYLLGGRVYDRWRFAGAGGARQVAVRGVMVSDDADVVRRWAIEGLGLAYKSWLDVAEDVSAGRLHRVLPTQARHPLPLHLVCPHRLQFSPAIRALRALLAERLATFLSLHPIPT